MAEITEKQAIQGFIDNLKRASSLIKQCADPDKNPNSSHTFVKCMGSASGYANILGNYQQNMDWYRVRDMIEDLTIQAANMAIDNFFGKFPILANGENGFLRLAMTLNSVAEVGHKLATSKAVTRQQLVDACNAREAYIGQVGK